MDELKNGILLKAIGGFYYVDIGENQIIECRARGKFRLLKTPPTAGDNVAISIDSQNKGVIVEILPRENIFIRPSITNVDRMFIVCSEAPPVTDTFLIDKVITIAESRDVEPVIVINKCDLNQGNNLKDIYSGIGLRVFPVSALTGDGIFELSNAMEEGISVFTGNSGVGKSSLLNKILTGVKLQTGEISRKIGRGKQTTRQVELFKYADNTYIADTPGFSSFDLEAMELITKDQVAENFREFREYMGLCEYVGCSHVKEKGCAIIGAVKNNLISESRFRNYVRIYESLKNVRRYK